MKVNIIAIIATGIIAKYNSLIVSVNTNFTSSLFFKFSNNLKVKKLYLLFLLIIFLLAQTSFVLGADNPPEITSRGCYFTRQ